MSRKHLIVGGSFVAAILVTAYISGQQGLGFSRQWDYRVQSLGRSTQEMQTGVDEMSRQGWELVDITGNVQQPTADTPLSTTFIATFKRPEQPQRGGGRRGGRGDFGRGAPREEAEKASTRKEFLPDEQTKKEAGIAAVNAELAAKQQAMTGAQRTLAVFEESFENSKLLPKEVYDWSSRIRAAQVGAADSRQQATKACQEHLQRMQGLNRKIASLNEETVPGGEPQVLHATEFYVAEAEVLLLEAKGSETRSQ